MKAMYEVTFYRRAGADTAKIDEPSDTRIVCYNASGRGFRAALKWADEHTGDDEFVGGVRLQQTEHI